MKKLWAFLTFFTLASLPANAAQPVNLYDASGNAIGSTLSGGKYSLNVNATLTESATAANASAGLPALLKIIGGYDGTNIRVLSTDSSGNLNVNTSIASVTSTGAAVPSKADYIAGNKAGNLTGLLIGQQTMANSLACTLPSDQSAIPVSESGTWNITNISGTVSLPTGASTAAKQPALGVAGTASTDVITVQGIASMTALKVDGSAVTQPISAASLPLPTGASTSALQTTGNTALTTINTTLGSPFQAGGSIGNTSFGVSGTLPAFAAIPTFKIDQTTPGTTNLVSIGTNGTVAINAAIPAGTNVIGKVSIDQTTPGTTNLVSIGTGGTVQTKAPLNSTGSGSAAAATVSTVITLTAPANAVGAHLMNIDTSTANIRWAVNRTATATLGQQLQPGRDVYVQTSHDISLVAESGTQTYDVQWISQ